MAGLVVVYRMPVFREEAAASTTLSARAAMVTPVLSEVTRAAAAAAARVKESVARVARVALEAGLCLYPAELAGLVAYMVRSAPIFL